MDAAERDFRQGVAREAAQHGENAVVGRTSAYSLAVNPRLNEALVIRPDRLLFEGDQLQAQLSAEREPIAKTLDAGRLRSQVRNALDALQARRTRTRLVTDQQLQRSRTMVQSRGSGFVRPPRLLGSSTRSLYQSIRPPGANMLRSQSLPRFPTPKALSLPIRPSPNVPLDLQQLFQAMERVSFRFHLVWLPLSHSVLLDTYSTIRIDDRLGARTR